LDTDAALASVEGSRPPSRSLTSRRRPLSEQRGHAARGYGAAEIVRKEQSASRLAGGCFVTAQKSADHRAKLWRAVPDRERGRRRQRWLLARASESQVRLQVVADQAGSKHAGDSRNRGN